MNWKTPITLAVLLLILLGSAYYGWHALTAPATSAAPGTTTTTTPSTGRPCTPKKHPAKPERIRAKDVVVNVYNAGTISGLAAGTMSRLAAKGFGQGVVTDAPAGVRVNTVAVLSSTPRSLDTLLVVRQFRGPVVVRDQDLGSGVDVVVGDAFLGVDPLAKPFLVVRKTVRSCVPDSTPTP